MNWRGRPLTSHEVIVAAISATTTGTGLRVRAELDTGTCPPSAKISDEQMAALPLRRHDWHGDWNYTLRPAPAGHTRPDRDDRRRLGPAHRRASHPLPGPARGRPPHNPRWPGNPPAATRQQ
jgi:hypothetical protein